MTRTILINKDNIINDSYLKRVELISTKDVENNGIQIEKETYEAYLKLKSFLETKKIYIGISSAYRTIEKQEEIYNEFIEKYGKDYTDKIVAKPRTSEHHTGLAIDIVLKINDVYLNDNNDLMKYDNIYQEIHNCLQEFGFILRYPQNKEEITKYPYEPWHIRYVGTPVSTIIMDNNWTLEEYLNEYSGIIVVNKPKGITSFDVVNEISKTLGLKRIGHTGTLDPLAEGVLVVTVGKATKVAELLTATYKEYEAGVLLGVETDTLDITGNVINETEIPKNINIEEVLNSYKKTYFQEVPIYSAIKVNGKKLYEYARNNEKVELPKKEVTIKKIQLLSVNEKTFTFKSLVSKGCYIRSLIRDIGKSLDTAATMTSLVRTKQGNFSVEESDTLEQIKSCNFHLYKIEEVLDYPIIKVSKEQESKISTGQKLANIYAIDDKVIFINEKEQLLGIYQKESNYLKTWKNFV